MTDTRPEVPIEEQIKHQKKLAEIHRFEDSIDSDILASLLELQRIGSTERPEKPEYAARHSVGAPGGSFVAHSDYSDLYLYCGKLLAYADRMAAERDAAKGAADAFWRIFSMQSGDVKRLIDADIRAEAAESKLARVVDGLRECRGKAVEKRMRNTGA